MSTLNNMTERIFIHARHEDVIQLEFSGYRITYPTSYPMMKSWISPVFRPSWTTCTIKHVYNDSALELFIQVVCNPWGGVKEMLEKMSDCEILKKKARFLHIVDNLINQCFTINVAHLLYSKMNHLEACVRRLRVKWVYLSGPLWCLLTSLNLNTFWTAKL